MNETHAPWPGSESAAVAVVDAEEKKQKQQQRIDNFLSISSDHTPLCNVTIIDRPYTEPRSVSGTYQLTVECNIVVAINFFHRWSNEQFLCVHHWLKEEKKPTQATYVYIFCTNRNGALQSTFFLFHSLDMGTIGTYNGEKAFVVSLLIIVCDFVLRNRRPMIAKHWTWLPFLCQVGMHCVNTITMILNDPTSGASATIWLFCIYLYYFFFYLPMLRPTHTRRNRDRERKNAEQSYLLQYPLFIFVWLWIWFSCLLFFPYRNSCVRANITHSHSCWGARRHRHTCHMSTIRLCVLIILWYLFVLWIFFLVVYDFYFSSLSLCLCLAPSILHSLLWFVFIEQHSRT